MDTMLRSDVRHEMLRIAGKKVETQAAPGSALSLGQSPGRLRAARHA